MQSGGKGMHQHGNPSPTFEELYLQNIRGVGGVFRVLGHEVQVHRSVGLKRERKQLNTPRYHTNTNECGLQGIHRRMRGDI